jgi:hypothetical protein
MTRRYRGDRKRPTAAEINAWNAQADRHRRAPGHRDGFPTAAAYDPSSRVVFVENTSGSNRDRFEVMSVSGLKWDIATDGSNDVVFEADTADADECPLVLIEPIANGKIGRAVIDGVALALVGGGTGSYATPDAANHRLVPDDSGTIKLLIPPHAADVKLLPVVLGVGGASTGHYLYTLTAAMSSGTGTATIRNMADDTEIETGASVVDTLSFFDGLAIGRRGICIKSGSTYYAIAPYVTDVQWDDPDLEYSKDGGSNWTNIDTAEDCS